MIHRFNISIPSLSPDLIRKGYIYLPDNYKEHIEKRYPVMYMFDGHNIFFDEDATYGKSWGLAKYLDENPIDMIIIGIECNHDGNLRLSEYTPVDFYYESAGKVSAQGKKYMDWLTGTLKPLVDKELRTLKDRKNTYICGSSLGGLMSLYGATSYNRFFNHAICLSPSLWISPDAICDILEKSKLNTETMIYMDYGSRELSNHKGYVKNYIM